MEALAESELLALLKLTWQLPQSTASLKSSQMVVTQLSADLACTPVREAKGASVANRIACFIVIAWHWKEACTKIYSRATGSRNF